jgi:hypothetical protein
VFDENQFYKIARDNFRFDQHAVFGVLGNKIFKGTVEEIEKGFIEMQTEAAQIVKN